MVEKLKSALEQIPWSLVIKGGVFGIAWIFLPYLLFVAVASFLFLSPPFQAFRFFPLLLLIFWLASVLIPGFREVVFLSILFVSALGIKNLVFIDRVFASQVLLVSASFLLWLSVFTARSQPGFSFLFLSLAVVGVLFFLFRFFLQLGQSDQLAPTPLFLVALISLLSFEVAWVSVLLPATPALQAVLLALVTAFFSELLFSYLDKKTDRRDVLILSGGFSCIIIFLLLFLPFSLTP